MIEIKAINIEDLTGLIGIERAAIIELLKIYCNEIAEEIANVKSCTGNKDWKSLQNTVHKIKGISANLYLQDMFAASEKLDFSLKENDCIDIEAKVLYLLEIFAATAKSIDAAVSVYNGS